MTNKESEAKIISAAGAIIAEAHKTRPSMRIIAKHALRILMEALNGDSHKTTG